MWFGRSYPVPNPLPSITSLVVGSCGEFRQWLMRFQESSLEFSTIFVQNITYEAACIACNHMHDVRLDAYVLILEINCSRIVSIPA